MVQPEELKKDTPLVCAKVTLPDDQPWAAPIALARHRGHDAIVRVLTR